MNLQLKKILNPTTSGNKDIDKIMNWKQLALASILQGLEMATQLNSLAPNLAIITTPLQYPVPNYNQYNKLKKALLKLTLIKDGKNSNMAKLAYILGAPVIYPNLPKEDIEIKGNILSIYNRNFFIDDLWQYIDPSIRQIEIHNCIIIGDAINPFMSLGVVKINISNCEIFNDTSKKIALEILSN